MEVIRARNVNEAYEQGRLLLLNEGVREESRAGPVVVAPYPVLTVYERPTERVLFDVPRDANPFFHLFESLWLLAGRDDARWLDQFVSDFSSRFAQDDGRLHGSYGKRWRDHFSLYGREIPDNGPREDWRTEQSSDQLDSVVQTLRTDPSSRQCVITMWDPTADLGVAGLKDRPCNTQVYLRVRDITYREPPVTDQNSAEWERRIVEGTNRVLDLAVTCRSNDIVWGAYGANAVQFSVLQEYLAGRIGVGVGTMYQFSNNWHGYVDVLEKFRWWDASSDPYREGLASSLPMGTDWSTWDTDLRRFMAWTEGTPSSTPAPEFANTWFIGVAVPMYKAHLEHRYGNRKAALDYATRITAADWRKAALHWLARRQK